ncbi:MAG: hypothetical protein RL095_1672 [Verrucomicrobiota bacterium]|jgi:hypothetical protein
MGCRCLILALVLIFFIGMGTIFYFIFNLSARGWMWLGIGFLAFLVLMKLFGLYLRGLPLRLKGRVLRGAQLRCRSIRLADTIFDQDGKAEYRYEVDVDVVPLSLRRRSHLWEPSSLRPAPLRGSIRQPDFGKLDKAMIRVGDDWIEDKLGNCQGPQRLLLSFTLSEKADKFRLAYYAEDLGPL